MFITNLTLSFICFSFALSPLFPFPLFLLLVFIFKNYSKTISLLFITNFTLPFIHLFLLCFITMCSKSLIWTFISWILLLLYSLLLFHLFSFDFVCMNSLILLNQFIFQFIELFLQWLPYFPGHYTEHEYKFPINESQVFI